MLFSHSKNPKNYLNILVVRLAASVYGGCQTLLMVHLQLEQQ